MKKILNQIELDIDLEKKNYDLRLPRVHLSQCKVLLRTTGDSYETKDWKILEENARSLVVGMKSEIGDSRLIFSTVKNAAGNAGLQIQMELTFYGEEQIEMNLTPLNTPAFTADHVLVHGRRMGGCEMIKTPAEAIFSSVFQNLITLNGVSLQFTHPLRQKYQSEINGAIKGNIISDLTVTTYVDPSSGSTISSEPVSLYVSENGHELMRAYGESERIPGKTIKKLDPGWNSWDYYRWTITEEEVLKNAEFIKNDPVLSQHIKRITIDDGWQYCYGEWDANPNFPNGMKYLAEKITEMGFEPGLWFAPGVMEPHARISQMRSEMLAQGISGHPCLGYECMKRFGFLLDPTRQDVQQWLYDLFSRYVDMGYKFFKLDFLTQTLKAKKFADPNVKRGEIIAKLVEPIREATKDRALLLGCNYNFEAGNELVDSVRTSADIHSHWECIARNSHSIATRFWSQNTLWDNDPDFAVCRGPETANDPNLHKLTPCLVTIKPDDPIENVLSQLKSFDTGSHAEVETLLSLVVVSGGCINLSDNIYRLNEIGLDLVRRTVSSERGDAGYALDLFESDYPAFWLQKITNGHRILLVNWQDENRQMTLDLAKHGITAAKLKNFWTDETIHVKDNVLTASLKPHSCLLASSSS